ncbi:hypothetical protein KAR91_63900 [Candidatus Pacearchaeota archaeon]|nr:hypothetical protein [Candidatus Pacearchaeota archaeon]
MMPSFEETKEWKEILIKNSGRTKRVMDSLVYQIKRDQAEIGRLQLLVDERQKMFDTLGINYKDMEKYIAVKCGGG